MTDFMLVLTTKVHALHLEVFRLLNSFPQHAFDIFDPNACREPSQRSTQHVQTS